MWVPEIKLKSSGLATSTSKAHSPPCQPPHQPGGCELWEWGVVLIPSSSVPWARLWALTRGRNLLEPVAEAPALNGKSAWEPHTHQ